MKRLIFFLLILCSWGFSGDFHLKYTQYTSCTYKPEINEYCYEEDPVWKSGSLRITVTDDSLLFVFLNKKTTYRIELNTIETEYNSDNKKVLIFTGRSGGHNYMFVIGTGYFNFLQIHGWAMYFSNYYSESGNLASRDFGKRNYPILSTALCYYNEKTESYDSNCTYHNFDEPRNIVLRTAYKYKKLYLYVDTLYTIDVSEVKDAKNSDSAKVLLYSGKDKDGNLATVAMSANYFNMVWDGIMKIGMMENKLPDELVQSSVSDAMVSGSSVAIAPDILITNAHVTKEMSKMVVYLDGKEVENDGYELIGELSDDILDLAIIRVKGAKLNACPLSTKEPVLGSDILVFGYPQIQYQGADLKVTKGIVSGKNGYQGDKSTFQIDAAVQHGNSGGPIVSGGKIIGLATSILNVEGSQNVNFGIKASKIYHWLKFYNVTPKSTTQDFSLCTYLLTGN